MFVSLNEALDILNIEDINTDDLRRKYKMSARIYHPDQVMGNKEIFQKLEPSYELLDRVKNSKVCDVIIKFNDLYYIKDDVIVDETFKRRINKLVNKLNNRLIDAKDENEVILMLNNMFYNKYSFIMEEYVRYFVNKYVNYSKNINNKDINNIVDSIIKDNELWNLSITDVNNLLNNRLSNYTNKKDNDIREKNKIKLFAKRLVEEKDNIFAKYKSYEYSRAFIGKNKQNLLIKLYDVIDNGNDVDSVIQNVEFLINSYVINIKASLEKEDRYKELSDNTIKYINSLYRKRYIDKDVREYYLDKVNRAFNTGVISKILDEIYDTYYYPKKAMKVRERITRILDFKIKHDSIVAEVYERQKEEILSLLDNKMSEDLLDFFSVYDFNDFEYTDMILKRNRLKQERKNRR